MTEFPKEIKIPWMKKIDGMSHLDLAILSRFAPNEFEVFRNYELWMYFAKRFESMGGRTTSITLEINDLFEYQLREKLSGLMARPPILAEENKSEPPHGSPAA